MLIIGNKFFAIVPKDDPYTKWILEYDPDHVELIHVDTMVEGDRITYGEWYIGLETAIDSYAGEVKWVCPW